MKSNFALRSSVVALIVAGAAEWAGSQPIAASGAAPVVPALTPSPIPTPPAAHVHSDAITGVKYLNGGVGEDEQQAIKAEASVFPFDLLFSNKAGEYVVVDKLVVRDKSRVVLTVSQAGPMLLAKLPPGKYAVEATVRGKVQQRTIEVAKSGHQVVSWRWDEVPS